MAFVVYCCLHYYVIRLPKVVCFVVLWLFLVYCYWCFDYWFAVKCYVFYKFNVLSEVLSKFGFYFLINWLLVVVLLNVYRLRFDLVLIIWGLLLWWFMVYFWFWMVWDILVLFDCVSFVLLYWICWFMIVNFDLMWLLIY